MTARDCNPERRSGVSSNSIIWGSRDRAGCQHVSRHNVSTTLSVNQAWGMLNVEPIVAMCWARPHGGTTTLSLQQDCNPEHAMNNRIIYYDFTLCNVGNQGGLAFGTCIQTL